MNCCTTGPGFSPVCNCANWATKRSRAASSSESGLASTSDGVSCVASARNNSLSASSCAKSKVATSASNCWAIASASHVAGDSPSASASPNSASRRMPSLRPRSIRRRAQTLGIRLIANLITRLRSGRTSAPSLRSRSPIGESLAIVEMPFLARLTAVLATLLTFFHTFPRKSSNSGPIAPGAGANDSNKASNSASLRVSICCSVAASAARSMTCSPAWRSGSIHSFRNCSVATSLAEPPTASAWAAASIARLVTASLKSRSNISISVCSRCIASTFTVASP